MHISAEIKKRTKRKRQAWGGGHNTRSSHAIKRVSASIEYTTRRAKEERKHDRKFILKQCIILDWRDDPPCLVSFHQMSVLELFQDLFPLLNDVLLGHGTDPVLRIFAITLKERIQKFQHWSKSLYTPFLLECENCKFIWIGIGPFLKINLWKKVPNEMKGKIAWFWKKKRCRVPKERTPFLMRQRRGSWWSTAQLGPERGRRRGKLLLERCNIIWMNPTV